MCLYESWIDEMKTFLYCICIAMMYNLLCLVEWKNNTSLNGVKRDIGFVFPLGTQYLNPKSTGSLLFGWCMCSASGSNTILWSDHNTVSLSWITLNSWPAVKSSRPVKSPQPVKVFTPHRCVKKKKKKSSVSSYQVLVWCLSCTLKSSPLCRSFSCGPLSSSLCCCVWAWTVR